MRDFLRQEATEGGAGTEERSLWVVIVPFVSGNSGLNTYWGTVLDLALEMTAHRGSLPEQWE